MDSQPNAAHDYQPLLLVRNISYPTYQLHATAGGKGAPPDAVLKIAILETMKWLRQRFRAFELPDELNLPDPDKYLEFDFSRLASFHLDMGYKLEVLWMPDDKIWTLQLTQPDLGTSPGDLSQDRQPVPGRLFETNVSYRMLEAGLECGFKTVVYEPQGVNAPCEVFRLAFIKRLARNPLVGLRQTWTLKDEAHVLSETRDLKRMQAWMNDPECRMPAVLFAEYSPEKEINPLQAPPDIASFLPDEGAAPVSSKLFRPVMPEDPPCGKAPTLPLDISALAHHGMGYAHFFILPLAKRAQFIKTTGLSIESGEALIIESGTDKNVIKRYPYSRIARKPNEVIGEIDALIQNYAKGREMAFGSCVFVPEAQELARESVIKLHKSREEMAEAFEEQKKASEDKYRRQIAGLTETICKCDADIRKKTEKIRKLNEEMEQVPEKIKSLEKEYERLLVKKEFQIRRLESRLNRPQKPVETAEWVEKWFEGRLILHERARDMMKKVNPGETDMSLICDALEYLAIEYRDELLGEISREERDMCCSVKYGRPFLVVPTSGTTVEMYPSNYKIKYNIGYKGKPVESTLDLHLKAGTDPANLLRIYFLYDKEKKLIVIGSMPRHLKTWSYS